MTISQVDREVKGLIESHSIRGLEVILDATMRAAIGRPFIDREYIHKMVDSAIDRAIKDEEEMV